jgi:hypothetical protein
MQSRPKAIVSVAALGAAFVLAGLAVASNADEPVAGEQPNNRANHHRSTNPCARTRLS